MGLEGGPGIITSHALPKKLRGKAPGRWSPRCTLQKGHAVTGRRVAPKPLCHCEGCAGWTGVRLSPGSPGGRTGSAVPPEWTDLLAARALGGRDGCKLSPPPRGFPPTRDIPAGAPGLSSVAASPHPRPARSRDQSGKQRPRASSVTARACGRACLEDPVVRVSGN